MNHWFTSDYHLGHENVIKYCNRPFKSLDEMNNTIINNHNSRVKKEDTVYFVGDFCFKNGLNGKKGEGMPIKADEWKSKLNGNIIFIKGNHDKSNSVKTIIERLVIGYGGYRINLVHKPIHADFNYPINLTGHVHDKWAVKRFEKDEQHTICINVGVDVNNFMPINFNEILKKLVKFKRLNT